MLEKFFGSFYKKKIFSQKKKSDFRTRFLYFKVHTVRATLLRYQNLHAISATLCRIN